MNFEETTRRAVHWSLLVVSLLLLLTGFGVTKYQLVEKLTFGILTKAASFVWHGRLSWVFIVLLVLHVGIILKRKMGK